MIRPPQWRGTRFFSTGNNGSARVGFTTEHTEGTEDWRAGFNTKTRRHEAFFGGWRASGGHGITRKTRKADCLITTNHQPPTANHQPPTANRQPPTTNHQPPTTNHQPPKPAPTKTSCPSCLRGEPPRANRPGHAPSSRARVTRPSHASESVPNRPAGPIRLEIPVNPPQSLKSVPVGRKNRHAFWRTFEEAAAYGSRSAELALC